MSNRVIQFPVSGYSGWHLLLYLLPARWQARFVARQLLCELYKGFDPATDGEFYVILPAGAFKIVDRSGRAEPSRRPECPPQAML